MLDKDFGERSGWICEPRFPLARWVGGRQFSRWTFENDRWQSVEQQFAGSLDVVSSFQFGSALFEGSRYPCSNSPQDGGFSGCCDGLQCLSWFCLGPRFKPEINTCLTFKWILIIEQMLRLGRVKATALHFRGFIKNGHGPVATEFSLKVFEETLENRTITHPAT